MSGQMNFCIYKANDGKEAELEALIRKHLPTMRELGLITDRDAYLSRSEDGSYIEVFQWATADGPRLAHEHPRIAAIWEAMGEIATFPAMSDLPEAGHRFPGFDSVELGNEQ